MNSIERLQKLLEAKPELLEPLQGVSDRAGAADALVQIAVENGVKVNAPEILLHLNAEVASAAAQGELSDAQLGDVAAGAVVGGTIGGLAGGLGRLLPFSVDPAYPSGTSPGGRPVSG